MKLSRLILVFFMFFILVLGACVTPPSPEPPPPPPPPPPVNYRPEAVTFELIRELVNDDKIDYRQLNYYLSSAIDLFTNELNHRNNIEDGRLIRTNRISSNHISIRLTDIGRIINVENNREKISISFLNQNIVLEFTRNRDFNRYEFSSAKREGVEYTIVESDRPYLIILSDDRRSADPLYLQGIHGSVQPGINYNQFIPTNEIIPVFDYLPLIANETRQILPTAVQSPVVQTVNEPVYQSSVKLQAGIFSRYDNAQSQVTSLTQAGFSPSIEQRGEMWAVIVVAAESDANRTRASLRDAGFESFPLR